MSPTTSIRDAIDDGAPNPRGRSLADISIVFACLSAFFVTARLLTRMYITKLTGADDHLIVVALVLAIGMTVSYNEEARNGFGLHTYQVDKAHKIEAFKWFFVAQLLYKIASGVTKVSILFLYLRIFPDKKFRIAAWAVMGVIVAYVIAAVVATIWQCSPIEKAWNKKLPGQCINIGAVWYSTSVMSIVTDLAIIVLPIKEILVLKLPRLQKIGLGIMFSLGAFVIATTVVRMIVVGPAITQKDTTYYQALSNSWTFLEVNVGIICACLPVLRAPIVRFFPYLNGKQTTDNSKDSRFKNNHSTTSSRPFSKGLSQSQNTRRPKWDNESDAEIMLPAWGIKKTTDIGMTVHDIEPGIGKDRTGFQFD